MYDYTHIYIYIYTYAQHLLYVLPEVTGGELTKLVHDVAQEGRLVSEFAAELPQHESMA